MTAAGLYWLQKKGFSESALRSTHTFPLPLPLPARLRLNALPAGTVAAHRTLCRAWRREIYKGASEEGRSEGRGTGMSERSHWSPWV